MPIIYVVVVLQSVLEIKTESLLISLFIFAKLRIVQTAMKTTNLNLISAALLLLLWPASIVYANEEEVSKAPNEPSKEYDATEVIDKTPVSSNE